jgi:hypothetical protein
VTSAVQVLERARELVSKDGGWTRCFGARDALGNPVPLEMSSAVSFCIGAAIARAGYELRALGDEVPRAWRAMREALGISPDGLVGVWNDADGRTQVEVVAAFGKAIEIAKGAAVLT